MVAQKLVEYINPPTQSTDSSKRNPNQMEKNKKVQVQLTKTAIDFATDSLHTMLCLKYLPKKIALTCIYMSAQYNEVRPTEGRKWLEVLDSEGSFVVEDLACKFLSRLNLYC